MIGRWFPRISGSESNPRSRLRPARAAKRAALPAVESLEERRTPSTFGIPWADPARLTLSFAPDGTPVAGRQSALFSSLNRDRSPDEWQRDILRAFHAWTSNTNLDVAVVTDDGSPFGTPGRAQGDPRFGDVRIGANRLAPNALAVSAPPDPALAGTLAGDVFLNADLRFKDNPHNLYRVMLHEAGHALGLPHSADPLSPMFPATNPARGTLTPADVRAIRDLYGNRTPDRHEGTAGNGNTAAASPIPLPNAYDGRAPILAFADLTTRDDVDVFWFDTVPGRRADQNVTVRVRTLGVSLLAPRVTVYFLDEQGKPNEVANVKADNAHYAGADLSVTFDGNDDDDEDFVPRRYYVRIERAENAPFEIGRYALAVSFDGLNAIPNEAITRVMTGPYRDLGPDDLARLLSNPNALVNRDFGANDNTANATFLAAATTGGRVSRHETLASVETAADQDWYRLVAPAGNWTNTLSVEARWLARRDAGPALEIRDAAGRPVPATVLVNDTGTRVLQATGVVPGATYFVRVARDELGGTGNYALAADFRGVSTDVRTFAEGALARGQTRTDTLHVAQAQLFRIALAAQGPPGSRVRLTVTDYRGARVASITALAGAVSGAPAFLLRPGAYQVRFEALAPAGTTANIAFRVRGNRITDPVGPVVDDPTLRPEYAHPTRPGAFLYPGNLFSLDPFYWRINLV